MRSIAVGSAFLKTCTDSVSICSQTMHYRPETDLVKWMRLDLREFVLHVVWVHGANLITCWGSQNLDDFDELVDSRFSWEKRLSEHEFCHNTSSGPNVCHVKSASSFHVQKSCDHGLTDLGCVVCRTKDEFRSAVVS